MKNKNYFFIAFIIFLIDRILKLVVTNFMHVLINRPLFLGVIDIKYIENHGISFGMFSNLKFITTILPLIIFVMLIYFIFSFNSIRKLGLYILIAGFLSNFWDRVFNGYVVDYIHINLLPFFVCNVADIAIFVGAILLIVEILNFRSVPFNDI